jgi:hypothetical protein
MNCGSGCVTTSAAHLNHRYQSLSLEPALVKLTPVKAMPSVRSEKVAEQAAEPKPAKKGKGKPSASVEAPPVEVVEKAPANCDGWGRRLGTASHFVCKAIAETGDDGLSAKDVALQAARLALAAGVPPRGAISTQLAHLKEQGFATNDEDGKWKPTADGLKKWSGK